MGIRPSLKVVFGYDDFIVENQKITDPRFHGDPIMFADGQEEPVDQSWVDEELATLKPLLRGQNELEAIWNTERQRHSALTLAKLNFTEYSRQCEELQKILGDMMHWDTEGWGATNVIGYLIGNDYDSDCFRILSLIDPKFQQSGYEVVPSDFEQCSDLMARYYEREGYSEFSFTFDKMKDNHWFYGQGYYKYVPTWLATWEIICRHIGLDFEEEKCKLMLVWEWS